MWVIGKFVLLCILVAPNIQGQFTPTLVEPNAYIAAVVDAFWTKLKEYGISNLPVPDVTFTYNVVSFGVTLIGPVSFEDGFVQDIDSVHASATDSIAAMWTTQATISTRILFENLRLYRDLRADLTTGMKVATCVITPATFSYQLTISKAHNNDTVIVTLVSSGTGALTWDMNPDDLLTRMIRRQALVAGSISGNQAELVSTTLGAWLPIFRPFLQEIVDTMEFPALHF